MVITQCIMNDVTNNSFMNQFSGLDPKGSFRQKLQEELVARCKRNPAYSLRAFALQLGVNNAALSQILSGKRPLTDKMIRKLANALELAPQEIEAYLKPSTAAHAVEGQLKIDQMNHDVFNVISDWHYFAIIELLVIEGAQSTDRWIAKSLGMTVHDVRLAMERLHRLNMIQKNEKNEWVPSSQSHLEVSNFNFSSAARKKWLKQNFELALTAIDDVPFERRAHSGTTMAIDSKNIEKAREAIAQFRRQMRDLLADSDSCDSVYHLSIGLFPLTKNISNKKEEKL